MEFITLINTAILAVIAYKLFFAKEIEHVIETISTPGRVTTTKTSRKLQSKDKPEVKVFAVSNAELAEMEKDDEMAAYSNNGGGS